MKLCPSVCLHRLAFILYARIRLHEEIAMRMGL